MMAPEGKLILCLDEFMLRLGHLKVLLRASIEGGGGGRKLLQSTAELLDTPVRITDIWHENLPTYLATKKLCHISNPSDEVDPKYPGIVANKDEDGAWRLASIDNEPLVVSWQDVCLSDPMVPSCVGAVKHTRRGDSKSPLSHILDWADAIELLSSHGELTFAGKLMAARQPVSRNPYIIGNESVIFLWLIAKQDSDALAYLIPRIAKQPQVFAKGEARDIFVEAIDALSSDAETLRGVSAGARSRIFSQLRELDIGEDGAVDNPSTAWHRASSRFESLVDMGVLVKGDTSEQSRYKYTYRKTPIVDAWSASLLTAQNTDDWMRTEMLNGYISGRFGVNSKANNFETVIAAVLHAARQIASPSNVYPLDILLIGALCNLLDQGQFMNIAEIANCLERYIQADPKRGNYVASRTEDRAGGVTLYL